VRKNHLDAETVLAAATERFITRFHSMERELQKRDPNSARSISRRWDEIWNWVKASPQEAHGSCNLSVSGHICLASHREVREHAEVKRKSGSVSDVSARLELWES